MSVALSALVNPVEPTATHDLSNLGGVEERAEFPVFETFFQIMPVIADKSHPYGLQPATVAGITRPGFADRTRVDQAPPRFRP